MCPHVGGNYENRKDSDAPKAEHSDALKPSFSLQRCKVFSFNPLNTLRFNFLVKIMAMLNYKQLHFLSHSDVFPTFCLFLN